MTQADKSAPSFEVHVESYVYLTVDEVWPDGDAPENPTSEDVAAVMAGYSRRSLLDDWELGANLSISVDGLVVYR